MTDQAVQALREIASFAEQQGAIVDRVEVALRETNAGTSVEFTAHLSPRPLEQATACTGYIIAKNAP
jgi:hypothetical protein